MKRLLLTGACGGMAMDLRPLLAQLADTVVLSGLRDIADLAPHEESRPADMANMDEVASAMEGCDAVIHLAGYSVEGPFQPILNANILGAYHLYEAARQTGNPRILFASSNHVVGFYSQNTRLKPNVLHRPDSLYGVSKSFGEALARFYFEKFDQETAIVRIGSCLKKPTNHRMLATWISLRDFIQLAERAFTVPRLGCPIIYGASANDRSWWDNSDVSYLGWSPQDNSESFAPEIYSACPNPDPAAARHRFQGGDFVDYPIFKENSDV